MHIGKPENALNHILEAIRDLEGTKRTRLMSLDEELKLLNLTNKATALSWHINLKWHTLAKCKWLNQGDANTKFFDNLVTVQTHINHIYSLRINEHLTIHSESVIRRAFRDHYLNLWKDKGCSLVITVLTAQTLELKAAKLDSHKQHKLCTPFTHDEITEVVKGLKKGKSPNLDGFTIEFYQCFWGLIGNEFTHILNTFQTTKRSLNAWNLTHLIFIPKFRTLQRLFIINLSSFAMLITIFCQRFLPIG